VRLPALKTSGARGRFGTVLLGVATLVNMAVAVTAGPFPYHDTTNHLTRYVLLEQAWFGQPPPWVLVRLVPTPYIGVDLLGVGLVHSLGPERALQVLALLPLILLPAGMYTLLLATAPAQRGWSLMGALFSFSWWYMGGSLNFSIGLGLLFFALALWWPRRRTQRWVARLLVTIAGVLLLCVHLFAALTLLGVVWLECALALLTHWRSGMCRRGFGRRLIMAVAITSGCAAAYLWMQPAVGASPVVPPTLEPRDLLGKLMNLGSPFFVFTFPQFGVMLLGYIVGAMAFADLNWRRCRLNPFLLSVPMFLALYLISPGTWNIDVRWLPMAYLLPFCMPTRARPPGRNVLIVLFGFCLIHALVVAGYASGIRRQLRDFDVTLSRLPLTARLLPLVTDGHAFRIRPYFHYALWHTIKTSRPVGGLFSRVGTREGDPTYPHLNHFTVHPALYFPLARWGVELYEPLDCERIRRDYDYILQAGVDAKAGRLIERCSREAFTIGEFKVYHVTPVAVDSADAAR
jgi:hypothetical protein